MFEITRDGEALDRRSGRRRDETAAGVVGPAGKLRHRLFLGLASLIAALSFGVSFGDGGSNHPVYLISGMRLLTPDFLANDWWAAQTSHYHHAFAYLTAGLDALNILPWSMAIGNIAAVLTVLFLLHRLLSRLNHPYEASAWLIITILFFCIDGTRSVALTYLFSPSLQPSTVSTVFFFAAMVSYVRQSFLSSGAFLGVASLFHANFLMLGFPFFGLAHFIQGRRSLPTRVLSQFGFATLVLAIQMTSILHVSGFDLPQEAKSQANNIMIDIAAPFHYKPLTYLPQFAGLFGWCLIALTQIRHVLGNESGRRLRSLFFSSLALILAGTLLTTVVRVDSIARLFVWRLAPFCQLLACIMVVRSVISIFAPGGPRPSFPGWWRLGGIASGFCLIVLSLIQRHLLFTARGYLATPSAAMIILGFGLTGLCWLWKRNWASPRFKPWVWSGTAMRTVLFLALCIAVADDFSWRRYNLLRGGNRPEHELFEWAAKTDPNSIFVIPPGLNDFRLFAGRAVVVDNKAIPYRPDEVLEWYDRMKAVCGENYSFSLKAMERGYSLMNMDRLKRAAAKYRIDYVVVFRRMEIAGSGLPVAFENKEFRVLRVPAAGR